MNYIKHLSGFFEKVSKDDRLNPTHISLYVSLFQFWNTYRFHNPISISRNEAMKVSKISSKVTYHKCIRELHEFGYLRYEPSYNPFKGSLVYLYDFQHTKKTTRQIIETGTEQVANSNHSHYGTGDEQALIPYINNTNKSKPQTVVNELFTFKDNENITSSEIDSAEHGGNTSSTGKRKKVAPKKEKPAAMQPGERNAAPSQGFKRPLREEVRAYFDLNRLPAREADKFYNHYESNGWLVGGKTKMQNWNASADNWMLNSENFTNGKTKQTGPGNLHSSTGKDYNEPL
jgi:hypothetical protein